MPGQSNHLHFRITGVILFLSFSLFFQTISFSQKNKLDSLANVILTSKDPKTVCLAHVKMAELMINNDVEFASAHADSSMLIARQNKLPDQVAYAYSFKGILQIIKGNFEQSQVYLDSAVLIFEATNNQSGLAVARGNLGALFQQKGDLTESLEHNLIALECYKKVGSELGIARTEANIGTIYHDLGDYKNALTYYKLADEFWTNRNSDYGTHLGILSNISSLYLAMGRADTAYAITERMMQIAESNNMQTGTAEAFISFGRADFMLNKVDSGIKNYEKGIELLSRIGSPYKALLAKVELATYFTDYKFYDRSITLSLQILDEVIESGIPKLERDIYHSLSKDYEAKKNYEKALEYQKKYIEVETEMIAADHLNKVSELEIQYKSKLTEDQILLLNEKNKSASLQILAKDNELDLNAAKISARNYLVAGLIFSVLLIAVISFMVIRQKRLRQEKTVAELEHRALRTQMNPHFIFNSLNSIQRLYVEGKTSQASDYMADFASLMRKILDNSSKENISLQEELHVLVMYIELENIRCAGMIHYSINVDPEINPVIEQIPPMVIQPFVENAIWHGILPKNKIGQIKINVKKSSNQKKLLIEIEDDGVGFKADKINSTHESKGIKITEQRIGNAVKIEPIETGGTRVTLVV